MSLGRFNLGDQIVSAFSQISNLWQWGASQRQSKKQKEENINHTANIEEYKRNKVLREQKHLFDAIDSEKIKQLDEYGGDEKYEVSAILQNASESHEKYKNVTSKESIKKLTKKYGTNYQMILDDARNNLQKNMKGLSKLTAPIEKGGFELGNTPTQQSSTPTQQFGMQAVQNFTQDRIGMGLGVGMQNDTFAYRNGIYNPTRRGDTVNQDLPGTKYEPYEQEEKP